MGEHKPNGNWYCPACGYWMSFSSFEGEQVQLWKRAQRVTDTSILFPEGNE